MQLALEQRQCEERASTQVFDQVTTSGFRQKAVLIRLPPSSVLGQRMGRWSGMVEVICMQHRDFVCSATV